jgi:hypothetical protein
MDLDAAAAEEIANGRMSDELAAMDAVVVGSEEVQREIAAKTPSTTVYLVGDSVGLGQSLNEVLVHLGFATAANSDR